MNTSTTQAAAQVTTAPCFLATNRGFYRGPASTEAPADTLMFTANIRQATPFNSFDEATACFKKLLANDYQQLCISGYYAVVAGVQGASKLLPAEEEAPPVCGNCGSSDVKALHTNTGNYWRCSDCDSRLLQSASKQWHPDYCICASCLNY